MPVIPETNAKGTKFIQFYSKSKEYIGKRLSNFYVGPGGVLYRGITFPSIEHAFQAAKYMYTLPPTTGDFVDTTPSQRFSAVADVIAKMTPEGAKRAGSRSGMKQYAVQLDVKKWNADSVDVMKALVASRMKRDDLYRTLVNGGRREGIVFLHFERSCARSEWGGCFKAGEPRVVSNFKGQNKLGKILSGVL